MARDEAYRKAEAKIEESRRTGATKLDLSCKYDAKDSQKLTELPESLGQLTYLKCLWLADNSLRDVPDFVRRLKSLGEFRIYSNKLTRIPAWLGELASLTILSINDNNLTELPESLGQLSQLQTLYLCMTEGGNKIADLPSSLARLDNLEFLDLRDNPLNPELAAANEQGLDAVKAYLSSMRRS